ncbi:MAG: hypothetical protein JWM86_2313 [Thermoleophilia bacterium]|nr:hypothetical protein [Thermoleophilia bacterium]
MKTTATWTNRTDVAARLLDALLPLPVTVAELTTSQLELAGATSFSRIATIVELHGGGHIGRGEDIAYSADAQEALPAELAKLDLAGEWTVASLSAHLDTIRLDLPNGMGDDKDGYHRWALEAAVIDLALRQRGVNLAELVDEEWQPVQVSLSMGLGSPPSADVVRRWVEQDPSVTFKLDASMAWTHDLVGELASIGHAVSTVDFKALYHGDWAENDYPVSLYRVVADGLPGAILEDARLDDEVLDAFDEDALGRLAWDYPITAVADVPGIEGSTATFSDLRPGAINIKPSRFGTIGRLLDTIARCDAEGIPCYSGGQYELGIGRTQVQAIASLCYPDAPNDCAPVLFHGASPEDAASMPLGPVTPPAGHLGFGWDAPTPATPRG